MKLYLKRGVSKSGATYTAIGVEKNGIKRMLTFDIEAVLLVTGMTLEQLYSTPMGEFEI